MVKLAVAAKRGIVVSICSYEVVSVASGKWPPITTLCERHPWLAPAVITALALHLAWNPQPRPQVVVVPVAGDCLLCPEPF